MKEQSVATSVTNDSTPPTEDELASLVRDLAEMKAGQAGWGASASRALKLLPRLARAYGALLADLRDAAGELLVDIPEPGTVVSKLLLANVLMRRELRRHHGDEQCRTWEAVQAEQERAYEAGHTIGCRETQAGADAALAEAEAKGRREAIKEAAAHLVGEEQSRAAAMIMAFEDALRTKRGQP